MIDSVYIEGRKVWLSREAQIVASRAGIEQGKLGELLAESSRIKRQNGSLTCVNVDDVRAVVNGKEHIRAPQEYFIGKILELNLHEGWYVKGKVRQLQAHVNDTLFVLPEKEKKQPPFLGHPLRYSVTKIHLPEREDEGTVVVVKFWGLRKATPEDLNPPES